KHNQIYLHEGKKEQYKITGNADRFTLVDIAADESVIDIGIRREAAPMQIDINVKLYLLNGLLFEATPDAIILPRENVFAHNAIEGFAIAFNVLEDGGLQVGVR